MLSGLLINCAPVDFDLSADQVDLKEAAAKLLERYAGHDQLRARVGHGVVVGTLATSGVAGEASGPDVDTPRGYDAELWAAMADQGWLAVEVAEADGGLGLSMVEVCVLAEQLGRVLAPAPYLSTVLCLGALADVDGERAAQWRDALAEGRAVGCVLWANGDTLTVEREAGGAVLSGRLGPALYAPRPPWPSSPPTTRSLRST